MLEGTFNMNIKITHNLPCPTHRNLLPVISNVRPLRLTLSRRLLIFTQKIRQFHKPVLRQMMRLVENDTRTVTGRNLRSILLLTDRSTIRQLQPSDVDNVCYYGEPEQWRVQSLLELIQIRSGDIAPPVGWNIWELDDILNDICCN